MRGRPRKPVWVLEASGAFQKNPQRRKGRENEPAYNGSIGNPPEYFNAAQGAIWHEFVAEAPEGALQKSDRHFLELASRLMHRVRNGPKPLTFWRKIKPLLLSRGLDEASAEELCTSMEKEMARMLEVSAGEIAVLQSCLASMGLTPASRSRFQTK